MYNFPFREVATVGSAILEESLRGCKDETSSIASLDTPEDIKILNSYASLAGFTDEHQTQTNPRDDVHPKVMEKIELHVTTRSILHEIVGSNELLFIRPCVLSTQDQMKMFGQPISKASEVLCARGARVLVGAKTSSWNNYCLKEPPRGMELERFDFINEDGLHILRCSLYEKSMKMYVGADYRLGEFLLEDDISGSCERIEFGTMIVEDHFSEQVFRFEKDKRHFHVLLYPEQLQICSVFNQWDPNEYQFLDTAVTPVFGVPLPDDICPHRRALLFASSFYLYDKYYQKDKRCRFVLGTFVVMSSVLIVVLVVLQKLNYFEDRS